MREKREIEITGLKKDELNKVLEKFKNKGINWEIRSRIKWGTTGYFYIKILNNINNARN